MLQQAIWNVPWFCRVFLEFSYKIDNQSCLKCCIFTKLSQIVRLINVHILVCRYARCNYRLWKVTWFKYICLGIFKYYYIFKTLYFHQSFTKCMRSKVKLCNRLRLNKSSFQHVLKNLFLVLLKLLTRNDSKS